MEIEWTDDAEEKLIDLWQQNACLYDITSKAYSDRAKKRSALEYISKQMNITGSYSNEVHWINALPMWGKSDLLCVILAPFYTFASMT